METIFKFRKGSFLKGNAQAVGERLMQIREARGQLRPPDIVQEAKRESSPLHSYFEWDDSRAAHEYRIEQARHLVAAVVLVGHEDHDIKHPIRAFVSITEGAESSYEPVISVMNDAQMREKVLAALYTELDSHKEKIAAFEEFSDIVQGIDGVQQAVKRHRKHSGQESRTAG